MLTISTIFGIQYIEIMCNTKESKVIDLPTSTT